MFSALGVLALYLLQRLQPLLPASLGLPAVPEGLSFNTAVSFVANTNWQSYSPEATMGYAVQCHGTGGAELPFRRRRACRGRCPGAGVRGRGAATIGNFWVDLTRSAARRMLLPGAALAAADSAAGRGHPELQRLHRGFHARRRHPERSRAARWPRRKPIKLLGTNGGGFFNANSAHPFENPTAFTNLVSVLLMLILPFRLPRTFGTMIGDRRQGYAILAAMAGIFILSLAAMTAFEFAAANGTAGAMEGKETRFGIAGSTLFGSTSTLTSTGAVNSMHDSFGALGGMMAMLNMMLGEIAPGGVGSGLYGMLVLAVVAAFISGLLVGRTPEYLGKKIGPREIKLACLYVLTMPALVLAGTSLSFALPGIRAEIENTSMLNSGPHGFSEVLYAFTSAANNNGSAFAGLTANTPWLNTALGLAMLLGRFLPIIFVLALAGTLAAQGKVPVTAGTLPTHRPQSVLMLSGVTVLVTALTFFPVLALGPLAEGLI